MEYKIILFVICSLLTMASVLTFMYFKNIDIKSIKIQNKVFFLSMIPYLILLVLSMDINLTYKIVIFIVSCLAGMAHLKGFDKIREWLHKPKG